MAEPEDPQPATESAAEDDSDSMDRVTPIRRVEAIAASVTPIYREAAPPRERPERIGVHLELKPFTPVRRTQSMRTMSDLTDLSNPVRESAVSRIKGRHFALTPADTPRRDQAKAEPSAPVAAPGPADKPADAPKKASSAKK